MPDESTIALFIERCQDYKATVVRLAEKSALPQAVAQAVFALGAQSLVVAPGFDNSLLANLPTTANSPDATTSEQPAVAIWRDDPPLSKAHLNEIDAVLTTSSAACAETGTIALTHNPEQGRRIITLLPDRHICIVEAAAIAPDVPGMLAALKPALAAGAPHTLISGPSATVDIELTRVEGVHGPRTLYVLVVN